MGIGIVDQDVRKLDESFSLQPDESTDVSGKAQLIAFNEIHWYWEHLRTYTFLQDNRGKTTRKAILNVVNVFFSEKVCTGNPAKPMSVLKQLHQWQAHSMMKTLKCRACKALLSGRYIQQTNVKAKDTSILNLYDMVGGFLKKAALWKKGMCREGFHLLSSGRCFPLQKVPVKWIRGTFSQLDWWFIF